MKNDRQKRWTSDARLAVLSGGFAIIGLAACPGSEPDDSGSTASSSTGTASSSSGDTSVSSSSTGGAGGTSGSGGATGSGGAGGNGSGGGQGGDDFTLTSDELKEGAMVPAEFTCDGGGGTMGFGQAPSFKWKGVPEGTMSIAMVMLDITLTEDVNNPQSNLGYHSAFWNVSPSVTSLPVHFMASDLGANAAQVNGGYLGPCPNYGSNAGATHTYEFRLYALPMASYNVSGSGTTRVKNAVAIFEANGAALAKAVLTVTSNATNL